MEKTKKKTKRSPLRRDKIVLLLSGGLDSVTLLYQLHGGGETLHAALFDYKQRHAQELEFAKYHCRRLGVPFTTIDLPSLVGSQITDGAGTWVVPNRNMILLALAANLAVGVGASAVAYACNQDDVKGFPDCRWSFINALNAALKEADVPVDVLAPYIALSKWQIGGLAREMGVETHMTWSCYRGGAKPCGKCPACRKRRAALR